MNAEQTKRIKHEETYIEFLTKRVNSSNFKANVSKEEFNKTEAKLKKAKLVLKLLKAG
jgi:CRISPR/Cas system-associated endoribonuclease Cas2